MAANAEVQRAEFTLNGNKMLAPLDRAAIARIEALCSWKVVHTNEPIVSRDSDSHDVFFVARGRCRIVNFSPSGREVAYAVAGPGEFFGEMAAIDGLPRSATVVALEDCVLGAITPQAFRDLIEQHPKVAFVIMEKLVRIVRTSDDRIMDLATTEQLAKRLESVSSRPDTLLVAESGIHTRADVERLARSGARAILVGESLMRHADIPAKVRELMG